MIKYEKKEVKIIEEVQSAIICDGCNKEIDPKQGYFHVCTSHHDWGNDSFDSLEQYDFCSPACLCKFSNHYIQDSYDHIFNTCEITIKHIKGYIH